MSFDHEFLNALRSVGLAMHGAADPVADGRVHRFRVDGDKAGSKNGWFVLDLGYPAHGAYGSWKTGQSHTWRPEQQNNLTDAEREVLARRAESARAARLAEQESVHTSARERAARLWQRAKPAFSSHPYLVRKAVSVYGLRDLRGQLVVPLRDAEGGLHSLQFIGPDGRKTFLTGGRKRGCYHAIGKPCKALCICEGYATAASIFQATDLATAVAFDAGNLLAVAKALRGKFPDLPLIIAADNDTETAGNPGLTLATSAARAVGAALAVPTFSEEQENV
jgi:putative DNA primase/helicase